MVKPQHFNLNPLMLVFDTYNCMHTTCLKGFPTQQKKPSNEKAVSFALWISKCLATFHNFFIDLLFSKMCIAKTIACNFAMTTINTHVEFVWLPKSGYWWNATSWDAHTTWPPPGTARARCCVRKPHASSSFYLEPQTCRRPAEGRGKPCFVIGPPATWGRGKASLSPPL